MLRSFSVVTPSPWVVDVTFAGADHARVTCGSTEAVVQASPNAVVDCSEPRTAVLDLARSRSFSYRASDVAQVVDLSSDKRVDEWGGAEDPDPTTPWAADGAAHLHLAFTDSDQDSPRLQLHGTGQARRLLMRYEGSEHLPEPVRAAMAATQIRHRNAGATPELVARTLADGERTWERFHAEDPYGLC